MNMTNSPTNPLMTGVSVGGEQEGNQQGRQQDTPSVPASYGATDNVIQIAGNDVEAPAAEESRANEENNGNQNGARVFVYEGQAVGVYDKKYTKVRVTATVLNIEDKAFLDWGTIAQVEFATGCQVERIGMSAFRGCGSLTTISIPPSVKVIDDGAFHSCALIQVNFPENSQLERIGKGAFQSWQSFPQATITIPSSVRIIAEDAFRGCGLQQLDFSSTPTLLERIGKNAFRSCESLTTLMIPASLKRIGEGAFCGCEMLQHIQQSTTTSLAKIGKHAFGECKSLATFEIPNSVRVIGEGAFYHCDALQGVTSQEPSRLETIGKGAFFECPALATFEIKKSVKSVRDGAFFGCVVLQGVTFQEPSQLSRIGAYAFGVCTQLPAITLPSSVVDLGDNAFFRCSKLQRLSIPIDLSHLGESCCGGCTALTRVAFSSQGDDGVEEESSEAVFEADSTQGLLLAMLDGTGRHDEFVTMMFESGLYRFGGLGQNDLDLITERTAGSKRMQDYVKDAATSRAPVFVMMMDGYVNIGMITAFLYASNSFLRDSDANQGALVAIWVFSIYFLLREILQMYSLGIVGSIVDPWNWIDFARFTLAAASAFYMKFNDGGENVSDDGRLLLLCTGVVVIGGLILFLRATSLPFAAFVGGLIEIAVELLPFLSVSTILLFIFAFMFFAIEYDQGSNGVCEAGEAGDFCSLSQAMLTTVSFFLIGQDRSKTWLEICFGIVVTIILLNIVIAVVSTAWEASIEKGRHLFWEYRIRFLAEIACLDGFAQIKNFGWIERVGSRAIRDRVNWESHPYNLAKDDHNMYKKWCEGLAGNHDHADLSPQDEKKLKMMGSFQRDWYWAWRPSSETALKVVWDFVIYLCLLLLGIPTCGLFWPDRFRRHIFAGIASESVDEQSGGDQLELEAMESRLKAMEMKLDTLIDTLAAQTSGTG